MTYGYMDIAATPGVRAVQAANGSAQIWSDVVRDRPSERFTAAEAAFVAARDSFYLATVSETGWPYVQHRGGPPGFLRLLDERTLGCLDFRGNRQYLSLGNLASDGRVSLFLMDYPNRRRLKIFAHAEAVALQDRPELITALAVPEYKAKAERALLFHLDAFDWNCPQHITPRFTQDEVDEALVPVRARITQLEAENRSLHVKLATLGHDNDRD